MTHTNAAAVFLKRLKDHREAGLMEDPAVAYEELAFGAALTAYHGVADRAPSDGQTWEEAMREAIDVYVWAMTRVEPVVPDQDCHEGQGAYAVGWRDAMRHVRAGRDLTREGDM